MKALVEAIRGQPQPPCDGCYSRIKCAKKQLACRDFTAYLHLHMSSMPSDRTPTRSRYLKAFPTEDTGAWS